MNTHIFSKKWSKLRKFLYCIPFISPLEFHKRIAGVEMAFSTYLHSVVTCFRKDGILHFVQVKAHAEKKTKLLLTCHAELTNTYIQVYALYGFSIKISTIMCIVKKVSKIFRKETHAMRFYSSIQSTSTLTENISM